MNKPTHPDIRIAYGSGLIVLQGDTHGIHLAAERLLRQFAHSAAPLRVKSDSAERIELETRH